MSEITTVGLDLAKNVFHAVCLDRHGGEVRKKVLRRARVLEWFANLTPCLVGMEGCAGSHYWARELQALGHEVRLIPAQHVKAYVRGQKNDYNDARAIAEAVVRPGMRFVAIKEQVQQDVQALHRMRAGVVSERTALCNRLRGLLTENGIVLSQGIGRLRRHIPALLEDGENGLSGLFRELLARGYRQLCELDDHIEYYNGLIERGAREREAERRLRTIPGFGPVLASAFHGAVGDGQGYRRGRDVSASLGVVPRQHSSGGKAVLLGISKRGDGYLRSLLVHGARSVVLRAPGKEDRLSRWVQRLVAERGVNKATVALANKLARIGWAVLRHNTVYQPA
ncbi:IS110 family transposase [Thioalkalivibrio sulfidiphilus]|uniref:Transposase IS116/IS110/IS902 family protein n=1 Tax=Thioalkalivibrio sulfidiphilus (strain HL-EbGR7) TaxID=396588 RepID=B8GNU2_THISH|nr:IS110 family transposase [Thioalkalivibrio sulfidiphilus]ACL72031.1 transposase IS116/IS110/IS902 family protein [Thioalkalivibrio sulfidiphilus HL-EbGr7]ACL72032.1 transposase IS116/IS110/IS902 family protein [Thioalkalivibrio sulfidiphilus HL-EbGr7]